MSSLTRRMQRMSSRSERAKKAAIGRQFATQLGVTNSMAKDLRSRISRHSIKIVHVPRSSRRAKPNKKRLESWAGKAQS